MDGFGPLVPGDEFVENRGSHGMEIGRLRGAGDPQHFKVLWNRLSRRGNRDRLDPYIDTETVEQLRKAMELNHVKVLNKTLELGELILGDDGELGEVIGLESVSTVNVPKRRKVALGVQSKSLQPITQFCKGERIYLKGWLGLIERVIYKTVLRTPFKRHRVDFPLRNGLASLPTFDFPVAKAYTFYREQLFRVPADYKPDLLWESGSSVQGTSEEFVVQTCEVQKLTVTWFHRVPQIEDLTTQPPRDVEGADLEEVIQFDYSGLPTQQKVNFCLVKEDGLKVPLVRKKVWKKVFVNGLFREEDVEDKQAEGEDESASCSGAESEGDEALPEAEISAPAKMPPQKINKLEQDEPRVDSDGNSDPPKLDVVKRDEPTYLAPNDIVDIIFSQQVATVSWTRRNTTSIVMSRELKRLSGKACLPFRQFVKAKSPTEPAISHGVTVERFLEHNMARVQWYKKGPAEHQLILAERTLVPEDLIQPHPLFDRLKPGELVVSSPSASEFHLVTPASNPAHPETNMEKFYFGVVSGVDLKTGRVLVTTVSQVQFEIWPTELVVIKQAVSIGPLSGPRAPAETKLSANSSGGTGDPPGKPPDCPCTYSAGFMKAFDRDTEALRKATESGVLPKGTMVRRFAESRHLLSLLVIGPEGTPYADGLFTFDIKLPLTYPAHSPVFHLSTPFFGPISYHAQTAAPVTAPFLNSWTGVEKWRADCTLLDAVLSVKNTIFVPEPADNRLSAHELERRYTRAPLKPLTKPSANVTYRRGLFNADVMIEVLDSFIGLAANPTGLWRDVTVDHVRERLPVVVCRVEGWIQAFESKSTLEDILNIVGYSVPYPVPLGLILALKKRLEKLEGLLNGKGK